MQGFKFSHKHILYIDDDEAIVFLMRRLLERQGYRVSGFTEAQAAIAAVQSNPGQFDLAVTNYNMPVMSGLDVARAKGDPGRSADGAGFRAISPTECGRRRL